MYVHTLTYRTTALFAVKEIEYKLEFLSTFFIQTSICI